MDENGQIYFDESVPDEDKKRLKEAEEDELRKQLKRYEQDLKELADS